MLAYGAYATQGRALGLSGRAAFNTEALFAAGLLFLLPPAVGELWWWGCRSSKRRGG